MSALAAYYCTSVRIVLIQISCCGARVQDQVGPELAAGVIEKGIDGRLLGFMDNDAWKELGATALQAVQLRVAVQELLRAINSS